MERGEKKENELEKLKKKIIEKLTNDEEYTQLLKKKSVLIEVLRTTEDNKYEVMELLKKYNNIGKDIKDLELKTAFNVLNNKKYKTFWGWIKKKRNNNDEYEIKFNSIVKDKDYRKLIKVKRELFNKMKEFFSECENQLYELDSLETEIATIETDKLRELFRNSDY